LFFCKITDLIKFNHCHPVSVSCVDQNLKKPSNDSTKSINIIDRGQPQSLSQVNPYSVSLIL
jgi:hypothetical protein